MKDILSFLNLPLDERRFSCLPYVDFSLLKRRASISRSPFSKQTAAKVNSYHSPQQRTFHWKLNKNFILRFTPEPEHIFILRPYNSVQVLKPNKRCWNTITPWPLQVVKPIKSLHRCWNPWKPLTLSWSLTTFLDYPGPHIIYLSGRVNLMHSIIKLCWKSWFNKRIIGSRPWLQFHGPHNCLDRLTSCTQQKKKDLPIANYMLKSIYFSWFTVISKTFPINRNWRKE